MHGYELRRQIEFRKMDQWADIKYGSIYPALRRLAASGAIEAVGTAQVGKLPPRTSYRITGAGRDELRRLLDEAWQRPRFSANAVDAALAFVSLLPAEDIERRLEERLQGLDLVAGALDDAERAPVSPEPGVATIVTDILGHTRLLAAAEQEWTRRVLSHLRAGAYATYPPDGGRGREASTPTTDTTEPSPQAGPTLEVIDLSPKFLAFYEQATAENAEPDRRWDLWGERYGFAAVPPTPEGQSIARALLDQAWEKYPEILDLARAGAAGLQPAPEPALAEVAAQLGCREHTAVRLVVFVGGFEGNAFTMRRGGTPTVCIPLEQDPRDRALVMRHELAHAVHMLTADLPGTWERPIGQLVFEEGLAARLTEALLPDRPVEDHVEYVARCGTPAWLGLCRQREEMILHGVLGAIDDRDPSTVARFTYGPGPAGLEREAYYAGWVVVGSLLAEGRTLAQLAHLPAPELVPAVRTTIRRLLDG